MNIAKKLIRLRYEKGLTQQELADIAGVSNTSISSWESGVRDPKIKPIQKICSRFGIVLNSFIDESREDYDYIGANNLIPAEETNYAPILGKIPAGYPMLAVEEIEAYAPIPYHDDERYFFLRVSGDSMIGAGINTGDLVLIRQQHCAENGQIVAARVNGDEATLKRYRKQGSSVLLMPENPAYEPRIVPAKDFETGDAEIIGVALEVRHQL